MPTTSHAQPVTNWNSPSDHLAYSTQQYGSSVPDYSIQHPYPVTNSPSPSHGISPKRARRAKPDHVPRPRNAFILFRSWFNEHRAQHVTEDGRKVNQNELSVEIGAVWKAMSPEEKAPFFAWYQQELLEHKRRYPEYHARPATRREVKGRKAKRAASESGSEESDGWVSSLVAGVGASPEPFHVESQGFEGLREQSHGAAFDNNAIDAVFEGIPPAHV